MVDSFECLGGYFATADELLLPCFNFYAGGDFDIRITHEIQVLALFVPMLPVILYLLVAGSYEGDDRLSPTYEKIETALKHYADIQHLVEPVVRSQMSSISSYTTVFREYTDTLASISKGVGHTLENLFIEIRKEEGKLEGLRKEVSELEVRRQTLLMELATLRDEGTVRVEEGRIHKQREQSLVKREKECYLKELELENERKVSFVKNIQNVLQEKISENELLRRQLEFYKRGGTGEKKVADKSDTETQTLVEPVKTAECVVGVVVQTKVCSEEVVVETGVSSEEEVVETEVCSEEEVVQEETVEEQEVQEEAVEEEATIQEDATQEEVVIEDDAEPSEESNAIEVIDFEYKGVLYYLDPTSREVYQRMDDDDVGEVIGKLDKLGRLRRI